MSNKVFGTSLLNKNNVFVVFVLVVFVFRIASTPTANASYLLIAAFAMLGRAQAIQALALSWLFTMISSGIAAEATLGSVGRYVVIAAAATSVFYRSIMIVNRTPIKLITLATLLLGLFFVAHSLLFSSIVDVSVFKALSWLLVMMTLISAWSGLNEVDRKVLESQIFGGLILVMLVSLPLLGLELGYLRNGRGFQGILNHPQAFGPTMALLGAWAASQLFAQKKPSWRIVALVVACFVLVVLSQARTAGLALILGVGIAVILAPSLSGYSIRSVLPGLRSMRVHLVLAIVVAGTIISGPQLSAFITDYIVKGGHATSLVDAYDLSRGRLMQQMWNNINDDAILGIGFGIASNPAEMVVDRDPVLGLPISASIEKGVLPLAVLEEVGIIGFAAVAVWVWLLMRRSSRGGVAPLAVALTALLLNMGESTLFSPGGLGLLSLILLGWAFASGQTRMKQ